MNVQSQDSVKELFFPKINDTNEQELIVGSPPLVLEEIITNSLDVSLDCLDDDFKTSRETIKSVIELTTSQLTDLTEIMKASDSPRAFEVGNQLLTTLASVSKDLLEIHERYHKMKDKQLALNPPVIQNNTQNNYSIFSGTTKELLRLIKETE